MTQKGFEIIVGAEVKRNDHKPQRGRQTFRFTFYLHLSVSVSHFIFALNH